MTTGHGVTELLQTGSSGGCCVFNELPMQCSAVLEIWTLVQE